MLYGKLLGLVNQSGYAFCSNAYLAEEMDIDKRTVQRNLQKMSKLGFIDIRQNGGKRRIYITNPVGDTDVVGGDKNVTGGVTKMSPVNSNTSNTGYPRTESNSVTGVTNETESNLITKDGEKKYSEEVVEVFDFYKKALIRIVNMPEEEVEKLKLKRGSNDRGGHINARLREGYTVKQLKQAILALCRNEWYLERGLYDLKFAIGNSEKTDRALLQYEAQERKKARATKEFRG